MGISWMKDDSPRVAVIGGGFIGPVHIEALRRIGIEVVGLLGSSPDRARGVADRLAIRRVYGDLDDLLGDPAVGSVHITSPNAHHFEQARRALESGRHVVCEKPLAITSAETSALRALAEARPRQAAAVNYNVRYYPLCFEMRDRVARGDLGRILSVNGSYTQDWLLLPDDYNWRVEPDGGTNLRAVADIGTHWMDLAQFVLARPIRSVLADLATFHPVRHRPVGPSETFTGPGRSGETRAVPITTEDHAAVLLRLEDGVRGVFHVSQVTAGRKNRLVARSRRDRRVDELGQRVAEPALDRPPQRPELPPGARPRPALPLGPRREPLPGRSRRGLPRYVQGAEPRGLRLDRLGRGPSRRDTPHSPTGTARSGSARRSRRVQRRVNGWTSRHETRIRHGDPAGIFRRRGAGVRRRAGVLERRADVLAAGTRRASLCGGDAPRRDEPRRYRAVA